MSETQIHIEDAELSQDERETFAAARLGLPGALPFDYENVTVYRVDRVMRGAPDGRTYWLLVFDVESVRPRLEVIE